MSNKEVAKILRNIAAAYTILNENRFKIIAYEKALDSIEHLTSEVKDMWNQGKLKNIPGIGPSIASHLDELFQKGKVNHFEEVLKKTPLSMYPLLDLSGFGPKKAFKLVSLLRLANPKTVIDDLEIAAKENKIAQIEGFGEKSQEDILEAIEAYRKGKDREERMPLPYAYQLAQDIVSFLKSHKSVLNIEPLGSLRRQVSTIGDIDLAAATNEPAKVIDHFLAYPKKEKLIEKGSEGATITLKTGQHIDLRIIKPDAWGSMLQYFTGSKSHNIHLREYAGKIGLSLNEYGIKKLTTQKIKKFDSEEKFYHFLDLEWIPPELRENTGEIEAALKHSLPKLVELKDIHGDLQIHSSFPIESSHDLGLNTMEEIIEKAKELKYKYIAFSEHNPSVSTHTVEEIVTIMKDRYRKIEQLKKSTKSVRILNLLEIDILADGRVSLPEEAMEYIDAALVSIHSSFTQTKEQMTQRVIKGLSHPKAKILAHPTGRLLNQRESIALDYDLLFAFCAKNNKALEINAYPNRLDLPDRLVKEAKDYGIKFTLGTDAHDINGMELMPYGVAVARRGWATPDDILNCLSYNDLYRWIKEN